jgi:hypothetical protein
MQKRHDDDHPQEFSISIFGEISPLKINRLVQIHQKKNKK